MLISVKRREKVLQIFMMRLSSSKNQRSKVGFRLKHFLQICLLLAICTWLLYQLMHSYSKKRAFEERITNKVAEQHPEFFTLGRKGLPLVKENVSGTDSKDEDIEEGQEEEGEQEHDMKQGEAEDEEGKDVDDPIDELDRDGGGEENERAGEFAGEEEKDGRVEEDGLFDEQEHEESVQEAREEYYKRDDASSAVKPEIERIEVGVDNVEKQGNGTVDDAKSNNNSTMVDLSSNVASGGNMMVPEADLPMKGSYSEAGGKKVELSKPENGSLSTSLSTKGSNQKELKPSTTTENLPENNIEVTANMSYSQMRLQKNPSLVFSASTRENPQHGSSGKTDTSKGYEPDDLPTTSE